MASAGSFIGATVLRGLGAAIGALVGVVLASLIGLTPIVAAPALAWGGVMVAELVLSPSVKSQDSE